MKYIDNFLKGVAIGVGAIIPGVSGGSLAVIFGIYGKLNDAIAYIFRDFKKNAMFFLPVIFGVAVGILAFSNIMSYLFENYEVEVKYLLIGLIVGTFSSVFRQANKYGFKQKYILSFIMALTLTLGFAMLDNLAIEASPQGTPGILQLVIYGIVIGFGTIIPGISASFILMYLGAYNILLQAISNIDVSLLLPMGSGFLISVFLFANLIALLFKRAYGHTYYAILGFVIGSVVPIFPGIALDVKYVICIMLFTLGFFVSHYLSKQTKEN